MREPFSLYKKNTGKGLIWYVRFWDEKSKKYALARSTGIFVDGKKKQKREVEQIAKQMLSEIRFETEAADSLFLSYLENFWKPDSPYVKEWANVKKKPISGDYVELNNRNIRLHIKPFPKFNQLTLRELTAGHIRDWRIWAADKGLHGRSINSCLQTMRVAVRDAIDREELDKNPFRNIKSVDETPKESGVLTHDERIKLVNSNTTYPQSKLAVLLGLLCGMRRGEVRGLKYGDIVDGQIHINHNFVRLDGLKKPKNGKTRIVPCPDIVEELLEEVRKITPHTAPDDFVLQNFDCPGKPVGITFIRNAMRRELENIGITAGKEATEDTPAIPSEQEKRNLTFHSLRHTFITLGRLDGLSDLEVQTLAGHSSSRMMRRYSHADKVLDFRAMRGKLNKAVGM